MVEAEDLAMAQGAAEDVAEAIRKAIGDRL
jgi:hypothetical protein